MLGVLITLVFALGAAGLGGWLLRRWTSDLDPSARFGVAGLAGLGVLGTLTLFIGLLPGGLQWGGFFIGALGLWRLGSLFVERKSIAFRVPRDWRFAVAGACSIALLVALCGVLAPSDTVDWDTLAYHLAVPKIWLAAGQIQYVSFIHHSNFPFAIDNLYIWGLTWGGQSGAKAFSLAFFAFGLIALFGLARQRYGEKAGWWAVLAFAATPMAIWLSGTAYIDVGNGLFGGLGILFATKWAADSRREDLVLSGVMLGLCAGSKYTGLQVLFSVVAVLGIRGVTTKTLLPNLKAGATIGAISLAICCPWYIKNVVNTGNPVYPFFYSVFGGKNWDAFSEQIYKEQQQTFGAGRPLPTPEQPNYLANKLDPSRLGQAVLGLAYQPGRYIDPAPTGNHGFIFGALGFVSIAAGLFWLLSGRAGPFEGCVLVALGIALLMWFFLSEQSRYILGLTVPLCVLAGGGVARLRGGVALAVGCVVQMFAALWVLKDGRLSTQLQAITGKVTPEEYQSELVRFYEPAQWINANVHGKVGLYDEVFGYFLDVPYFWAGPGHTTEIGYEHLSDGAALAARLKQLGMTHVYIDLSTTFGGDRAARDRWARAAGLGGPADPYTPAEIEAASKDIRVKYKVLLAEAIAGGQLRQVKGFGTRLIFELP